jgi:citrate synthase
MDPTIHEGLENVVVTATRLSEVDGARGRLTIAGESVEHCAARESYEEVCARLWSAGLDTPVSPGQVRELLGKERLRAFETLPKASSPVPVDGMDHLRGVLSAVDASTLEPVAAAARLTATAAVAVAQWSAHRRPVPLPRPNPALEHAADYANLLLGGVTDVARQDGVRAYLVTVSDHGMNASTFTARVIASTASDLVSACVGAVGALKGPLHGGAPGPVLDMLDAIGAPEQAQVWIETELRAGRRIMGMGHRVYRVRDPRAAALEAAIERLERAGVSTPRLTLAREVEGSALKVLRTKYPDRGLEANVEFYTAVLLDSIGLDREVFSPTFGVGRIGGWIAHYFEQRRTGRLIRPESIYIGPKAA